MTLATNAWQARSACKRRLGEDLTALPGEQKVLPSIPFRIVGAGAWSVDGRVASASVRRPKKIRFPHERGVGGGSWQATSAIDSVSLSRYRQPGALAGNSMGTIGSDVAALPWHRAEGR